MKLNHVQNLDDRKTKVNHLYGPLYLVKEAALKGIENKKINKK